MKKIYKDAPCALCIAYPACVSNARRWNGISPLLKECKKLSRYTEKMERRRSHIYVKGGMVHITRDMFGLQSLEEY